MNEKLSFVAGVIEGEGCIGLKLSPKGGCFSPFLTIWNTDKELLTFCQSVIGGRMYSHRPSGKETKIQHFLEFHSQKTVMETLRKIKPFSVTSRNKQKAEDLIEWCRSRLKHNPHGGGKRPYTKDEMILANKLRGD